MSLASRLLLVSLLLAGATSALFAEELEPLPKLKVVARHELPPSVDSPVDIRWATEDSVYVAYSADGVIEITLDDKPSRKRRVFPGRQDIGFNRKIYHFAISADWSMIAGSSGLMALGRRVSSADLNVAKHALPGNFHDVDLHDGRLALLGFPTLDLIEKTRGVLWLGDVEDGPEGLRPILEDKSGTGGPGAFVYRGHRNWAFGAVRFLSDGSLIAVPVFQSGIHHFDGHGKLKHTWTAEDLSASSQERIQLSPNDEVLSTEKQIKSFLGEARLIEEVLAFRKTPAVIVRASSQGKSRYWLGLLGFDIEWFEIPLAADSITAQVKGDVDGRGRIVLLSAWRGIAGTQQSGEVVVLDLP